jgi:D-alanyl-D-alanine carboxypeptidase/D-alanyl-D-alanine-endopeptidase (penicillin-binding protein 4)
MVKNLSPHIAILSTFILLLTACSAERQMARKVSDVFERSEVLKKYHAGFALYDPSEGAMVYQQDADKYFTPASNTKLFTFYAGLKMLPDSIPSLRYIEKGDSLIFWGTGDPSNLQSQLKNVKAYNFLKASGKKLFFASGRYKGSFYGKGWQWDDYNDYYQAEIDEFPLMDNLVDYAFKNGSLAISPKAFAPLTSADTSSKATTFSITRSFIENKFTHPSVAPAANYNQKVPFKVSVNTTIQILSDTLSKTVQNIQMAMPANAKTLYGIESDSVLKEMMLPSDNFIAEQLLLVYSDKLGQELSSEKAIAYIQKEYLSALPDKFIWADGSGLSRYDLVTPRSVIKLLDMIYKEVNDPKRLFSMLPGGGMSGTLRNAYPKTTQPFVFGKTGSLANVHNQSGYVVTKKGKTYLFSFLNNNFVVPTSDVRKEMVRIMTYIHENY